MDLIPQLDLSPLSPEEEKPKTSSTDDSLGRMLQTKWDSWSNIRRLIEEEWLKDLRAFNQQNEPDVEKLSKFHDHIYIGMTRTKCMSAYARITDLIFQARDRHWSIEPTPIPESKMLRPGMPDYMEQMKARAEAMEQEIDDQLIDLHYEDNLKSCILEACILGTGVYKGVIPGVKCKESWGEIVDEASGITEWDITKEEIPFPQGSAPSIFDIYPDPYANCVKDMSGLFERHTLNRSQFAELKEDNRFDSVKIDEILSQTDKGNHIPLYHETQRRNIGNMQDTTANGAERYDLLEYWGQVSGKLLQAAGVSEAEDEQTYWANVWTCSGKTLLAKIMPMKKQRIPYNFFVYNRVPHQFWGIGPARMMRFTQAMVNGSIRSLLDGMAMLMPMAEVNVHMLKEGQDPSKLIPGMIWLRDKGDASVPAVRFFQPSIPTGQLMQLAEMAKGFMEDETALPAYSYGDDTGINDTAKGLSMQMSAASLPIKSVVKNLEDGVIKPFIVSLYDWNMQWSDRDDIKGDMQANVLATSTLMAKEVKSQQLLQFLNLTANPLDMQFVDRKYLLTQMAKAVEIDTKLAIPDELPPQAPQETAQPNPIDQAKALLIQAQVETEKATASKIDAEKTEIVIKGMYESIQASNEVAMNPSIAPMADSIFKSAGGRDYNGGALIDTSQPTQPMQFPVNTHTNFPANPQSALPPETIPVQQPEMQSPGQGAMQGIEAPGSQLA